MKKNIHTKIFELLKSKGIMAVSAGLLLASCSTQMGGYSETDGVYYDPNKDTLPEGIIISQENRVGEYYDYENTGIIENNQSNLDAQKNKYDSWGNQNLSSDWGSYAGSEVNYHDWGWSSPWNGWYGYSPYWGSGWRLGISFGWGGGWYGYNPYWNYGYNPYYWNGYYPYWYGGYYTPYYGHYGYSPYYNYRRSGADGRYYNTNGASFRNSNRQSAFRNNAFRSGVEGNRQFQSRDGIRRNAPSRDFNSGLRNGGRVIYRNDSGIRNNQPNNNPVRNYESRPTQPARNYDSAPRNNGGFRSGSDSGTRSGGGFNGGGSSGMRSGGGTRTGGFR